MSPRPVRPHPTVPPERLAQIFGPPPREESGAGRRWVPETASGERDAPAPRRWGRGGRHRRAQTPPALVEIPAVFRDAMVGPGRWAVGGVALIVLAVVAVLGVRVWQANAAGVPTAAVSASPSGDGSSTAGPALRSRTVPPGMTPTLSAGAGPAGGAAGSAPAATPAATTSPVVVHVVGEVRRPGVVRLPPGSRVQDAVSAAGGATSKAALEAVNLARVLADGEQIDVPARGEATVPASAGSPAGQGSPGGGGGLGAGGAPGPVDLNRASATDLDALPGVGPVLAGRIVAWRTEHGRFTSVDELGEVDGIGDKMLSRLRDLVRV